MKDVVSIVEVDEGMPHVLSCAEVWGGNGKTTKTVELPGLECWISSLPLDDREGGGDVHYFSVCDVDLLSRVALADVSGHGREISSFAESLHSLLRGNVNVWDQSDLMRDLNLQFGLTEGGKYATAIILSYHRLKGKLLFTNAGHLPPLWYHHTKNEWGWLEESDIGAGSRLSDLPVGLISGTTYHQTVLTLDPGDTIVLYTDGIVEAENAKGQDLGRERLLEWARSAPVKSAAEVGGALSERLNQFRGGFRTDDETLLVIRRQGESICRTLVHITGKYLANRILTGL